jgi:hypothetical protein
MIPALIQWLELAAIVCGGLIAVTVLVALALVCGAIAIGAIQL